MCLQDVKLGERRYWRSTGKAPGVYTFAGDQRRVGLRIVTITTAAAEAVCQVTFAGNNSSVPEMYVNQGRPVDEIWLQTHGVIVQQPFSVSAGGNVMILEFLDNDPDAPTD